MRDEVWSRLVKAAGEHKHVVRLGFDKKKGVDLWDEWLEEAADAGTVVERDRLAVVDRCLNMIASVLVKKVSRKDVVVPP